MNARVERRYGMGLALQALLEQEKVTVAKKPGLVKAKAELDANLLQIAAHSTEQEQKNTAKLKQAAAGSAVKLAVKVISGVKAYAMDQEKQELLTSFNYSKSGLERLPDTNQVTVFKLICKNAKDIVADTTDFGTDAALLALFEAAITKYEALLTKPKNDTAKKTTATKGIAAAVRALMATIEKMDNIVVTMEEDYPEFYAMYQSVRKISDPRGGKGKDGKKGGGPEEPKK